MDRQIELLVENFGLERLLIQNDISEYSVVKLLLEEGLIDLDDYMFEDTDNDQY